MTTPDLLNELQNAKKLSDVVDEYLHWRKVNPHIKGGENYLKRFRDARQPEPVSVEVCAEALFTEAKNAGYHFLNNKERFAKAVLDAAGVKYVD